METRKHRIFECRRKSFKSYYVVWKLESAAAEYVKSDKFKSYYVVWKLYKYKNNNNI